MANPDIQTLPHDIRYEDRGGCFVLVDPSLPEGQRDIASTWEETSDRWRWRINNAAPTPGQPYPTSNCRNAALTAMLAAYASDPGIALRLKEQTPRFSFGEPQIFRA